MSPSLLLGATGLYIDAFGKALARGQVGGWGVLSYLILLLTCIDTNVRSLWNKCTSQTTEVNSWRFVLFHLYNINTSLSTNTVNIEYIWKFARRPSPMCYHKVSVVFSRYPYNVDWYYIAVNISSHEHSNRQFTSHFWMSRSICGSSDNDAYFWPFLT